MAVQTAISSTSGGRMGIPKAVVMVVTDRSIDSVQEAANEALTAGWWNSFLALLIHSTIFTILVLKYKSMVEYIPDLL